MSHHDGFNSRDEWPSIGGTRENRETPTLHIVAATFSDVADANKAYAELRSYATRLSAQVADLTAERDEARLERDRLAECLNTANNIAEEALRRMEAAEDAVAIERGLVNNLTATLNRSRA